MQVHVAQYKVREFLSQKLPYAERRNQVLKLVEEVGELADAVLRDAKDPVADALGDCFYVLLGIANLSGVDLETVFEKIHESNMTKLAAGKGEANPTKGPSYQEPRL